MYRRPLRSGLDRLFPMAVMKTVGVAVTGVLTVTVTMPAKSYVNNSVTLNASWDGVAVGPFVGSITWGDGASENIARQGSKSVSRNHVYGAAGTFTAKVSISDETTASGGSGQASITIGDLLDVTIKVSPSSGNIPLAVTFTMNIIGGFSPYSWSLDPGDGSSSYSGSRTSTGSFTQAHTYNKMGSYTATLTVSDKMGSSMYAQTSIGAGVPLLFPNLREMFPNLFKKLDQFRNKRPKLLGVLK